MEPPPSEPVAREQRPAMRAAPAPPLDPPLVCSVFQGFRQASPRRFSVVPDWPNSGVLVLPRMIAPACRTRSTSDGIFVGDVVSEDVAAHGAADALGELQVLDGDGDAVEGPEIITAGYSCFCGRGRLPGEVCGHGKIRVELGVKGVDAVQEEVYELSGGDLFGCDHVSDFPGWCECEIGSVHGAPPVGWGGGSSLVWGDSYTNMQARLQMAPCPASLEALSLAVRR